MCSLIFCAYITCNIYIILHIPTYYTVQRQVREGNSVYGDVSINSAKVTDNNPYYYQE